MKFTNGYWLLRDGVEALYARQAYELSTDQKNKTIHILAPASVVKERANTLNLPTFDIHLSSPAEGVIRVQATHWKAALSYPGFPLHEDDRAASDREDLHVESQGEGDGEIGEDGASVTLTTGALSARVVKGAPWNLTFTGDGKELTKSEGKSLARFKLSPQASVSAQPVGEFGVSADGRAYEESDVFTSIQLHLNVGELVYGFGERFGTYVKNGQSIDIWNEDGGTASEQGYKDIPFYMTSQGYGLLVNNRGHVSYEIGSENTEAIQFSVPGEALDFCVIYGPTPKEILKRYTALVGRPADVPAWSYGLWLTTSFTTKYDEKTILSFVDGMENRGIPLSAFHYDCYWMREFHWTDFEFDRRFFGTVEDVKETLSKLHDEKGLHICAWINPYLGQAGSAFDEALEKGYLVRKKNGEVWQTDLWQAGMGLVDFTNPDARKWYKDKIKGLLKLGIDAIKTDFGERIPRDVIWYDHSPSLSMHNWYTQLYNQTVFEALEETYGKGNACLYARSATVGGQMQPVHWGGDCESSFNGMAQTLRAGLSLTNSGFGFWSHDIGGFEGAFPDSAVYKRWVAFGMLGSHSRLHGSTVYRVPWLFDEADEKSGVINKPGQTAVDVVRQFTLLKLSLMPYLYEVGLKPHREGTPVMRSMFLEFPDDPSCRTLDREYMFGPSFLVAPVFSYSGEVEYFIPRGTWVNWFTGEKVSSISGVWRKEKHSFDSIPLWVRDNSVIVSHPGAKTAEYAYADNALVSVFMTDGEEALATISENKQAIVTFTARKREDGSIEVRSSDGREFSARREVSSEIVHSHNGIAILV